MVEGAAPAAEQAVEADRRHGAVEPAQRIYGPQEEEAAVVALVRALALGAGEQVLEMAVQ